MTTDQPQDPGLSEREAIARIIGGPAFAKFNMDARRAAYRKADAIIARRPATVNGEVVDLIAAAYEQGCHDVHNNCQEDLDPEFGEAAMDYAHAAIRLAEPSPAPVREGRQGEALMRKALEFADYLAAAAARYLDFMASQESEVDHDARHDLFRGLRSASYAFAKRRSALANASLLGEGEGGSARDHARSDDGGDQCRPTASLATEGGAEIRNALRLALAFAEQEAEQRSEAGGSMSDYITEAEDVVGTVRAALRIAEELL